MAIMLLLTLAGATWVETGQPDFANGTYGPNIYASWRGGGAVEFVYRFDLNDNGHIDLFVSDRETGKTHIYWGSDSGYSAAGRTSYPSLEPVNPFGADLDFDGRPEFIANSRGGGQLLVFKGGPDGPYPDRGFRLPGPDPFGAGMVAADFNKDGYLDLTIGGYANSQQTYIYWGGPDGYSTARRTSLPGDQPCHNPVVADFNQDGWLDFLQSNDVDPQHIYWGGPGGFSEHNRTALYSPGSPRHHGKSAADLNNDGWLDLVFTTQSGGQSYIYRGGPAGFSERNRLVLQPGNCDGGSAVADLNNDGWLDIVFAVTDGAKPVIYWGSPRGFSDNATTRFGYAGRYLGLFIADLDGDGALDIFMNNNMGSSPVFYGPRFETWTRLPTSCDHYLYHLEPGNVYDRSYFEEYVSSVYDGRGLSHWQEASWDATMPGRSSVLVAVRTGNTPGPDRSWSGWVPLRNGSRVPDSLASRYIQYRVTFGYRTPAMLPAFHEFRLGYDPTVSPLPDEDRPAHYAIRDCSPNPFSGSTRITYALPARGTSRLEIYNSTGRLVRALPVGSQEAGIHTAAWDGRTDMGQEVPSGLYLCRLTVNGETRASARLVRSR